MRSGEAADGGGDELELRGDGEIEDAESEIEEAEPDGGEDDAAEGGADADAEVEQEEPSQQVERRESRYQRAIREAREAKNEARQLRDEFERTRSQPQQQQPDPQAAARAEQEFIERLRVMDPADAMLQIRDRERQIFSQAFSRLEGQTLDRMDKAGWDAAVGRDQARRRLSPDVDRYIANARQMGNWQITRENVFHLLYGQEMDKRRREAVPRQQRAAQRRVAAVTTRPGSGRGEAARAERRPEDGADEALLRQVTIGDI